MCVNLFSRMYDSYQQPCYQNFTPITFSISSEMCVMGGCGKYGRCYQFFSGGNMFSTCSCFAGKTQSFRQIYSRTWNNILYITLKATKVGVVPTLLRPRLRLTFWLPHCYFVSATFYFFLLSDLLSTEDFTRSPLSTFPTWFSQRYVIDLKSAINKNRKDWSFNLPWF